MTNETKSNSAQTAESNGDSGGLLAGWLPGSPAVMLLAVMAVVAAMAIGALATAPDQSANANLQNGTAPVRPAAGQANRPATPPNREEIARRVFALQDRLSEGGGSVEDWKMLGRSLLQLGRYGEAVGAWSQAAKLDGSDPEIQSVLTQLREMASGQPDHPTSSTLP